MLYPDELRALFSGPQYWKTPVLAKSGRGREIRTPDILLPKQARYQTALYPDAVQTALFSTIHRSQLRTF